jgi:hypothetical protein
MFAGLMSRWMMPDAWAASSAPVRAVAISTNCRPASARQPPLQRFALQQFHHQERHALGGGADVVDRADVRMPSVATARASRSNRARRSGSAATSWQHFDGNRAIAACRGPYDFAHPARAERREDLVGAEARAGRESHSVELCGDRANCTGDTRAALGQTGVAERQLECPIWIARTRSSQGRNSFLSSSAGAWRPYSHSSNASAYFTAFPRSAP